KMDEAALGLGAPVPVGRHIDAAHGVGLMAFAGGVDPDWHEMQRGMRLGGHVSLRDAGVEAGCPRWTPRQSDQYCGLYNWLSIQLRTSRGRSACARPVSNMNSATRVAVVISISKISAWPGNSMPLARSSGPT